MGAHVGVLQVGERGRQLLWNAATEETFRVAATFCLLMQHPRGGQRESGDNAVVLDLHIAVKNVLIALPLQPTCGAMCS